MKVAETFVSNKVFAINESEEIRVFLYYTFGAKHQLAEILCGGILQIGMMTFTKGLSKYLAE